MLGLTRTLLRKVMLRSRRGANNLGRLASSEARTEAGASGVPAGGSCFGVKYGTCFHVSPYESSITPAIAILTLSADSFTTSTIDASSILAYRDWNIVSAKRW